MLELFLMQFQCSCVHHLILNLNLFLCLSLFTLIKMLVCGRTLLPLTNSVSIIIAHKTIQFLIFFQMEDQVKESNYMLQEKSENVHTCNSAITSMTASTTTGICQWWIISTPTDRGHLSYIQR